jgi:hypothetical protein
MPQPALLLRALVPAVLVAFAAGCSPSAESAPASADGGAGQADGGGGDGGDGDGSAPAACTTLGANVVADDAKELSNLSVAGTSLVFLSADLSLTEAPGIETIGQDGTGRTTLYRPVGDRRVHGLLVQGDRVLFFEQDNAAVVPAKELWSVPLAGGAPTRIGAETFVEARMIGADATNLYVSRTTDAPIGVRFDRIDLATGAVANAAVLTGRGGAAQVHISGNDVFLMAGGVGDQASVSDIFRFDKNGTGVTPTALPGGTDALCDSRLGGLWATPTKLACGFDGVKAGGRDGTGIGVVVPSSQLQHLNVLVGSDAENLYVTDRSKAVSGGGTLHKVASTGGALFPIACDLGPLANRLVDAFFPVQTEYELVIGASEVFWIEKRGLGQATKWFVRHAAK